MKIANLEFRHGLFLAPMAGITDHAFREACVSFGAEGVTSELISAVWNKLQTLPPIKKYESENIPLEMFEKQDDKGFTIRVIDDVYFVEAKWLLKILQRTDLDDYESLQYFQRILISSGIIDALRERGINEGDTVSIYDLEFDFVN